MDVIKELVLDVKVFQYANRAHGKSATCDECDMRVMSLTHVTILNSLKDQNMIFKRKRVGDWLIIHQVFVLCVN